MDQQPVAAPAPPGWIELCRRAGATTWHHGSLVCVHFIGPTDETDLEGDFAAQDAVLEHFGELTHLIVFHANRIGRITALARQRAAEHVRAFGPRLRCSAIVLVGDGLGAVLLRVGIAGANLLTGAGERHRLFENLADAVHWLEQYPGQHASVNGIDPEALGAALGISR